MEAELKTLWSFTSNKKKYFRAKAKFKLTKSTEIKKLINGEEVSQYLHHQ